MKPRRRFLCPICASRRLAIIWHALFLECECFNCKHKWEQK